MIYDLFWLENLDLKKNTRKKIFKFLFELILQF